MLVFGSKTPLQTVEEGLSNRHSYRTPLFLTGQMPAFLEMFVFVDRVRPLGCAVEHGCVRCFR